MNRWGLKECCLPCMTQGYASNQVVDEVKKHFGNMVFSTIIQRNVKLSEAPSFGETIIDYDASSKGASSYLKLAEELIHKNKRNGKS